MATSHSLFVTVCSIGQGQGKNGTAEVADKSDRDA
jgi:hypothetical protein